MKVLLVCLLLGVVFVTQSDARGIKDEMMDHLRNCTEFCHNKYPNGGQAMLDTCITICEMERIVTVNPTGVNEETQSCWIKCNRRYPFGPQRAINACLGRCVPSTGVKEETGVACSERCHLQYPFGPQGLIDVCIHRCEGPPAEVKEEELAQECWKQCTDQYPNGPPRVVNACFIDCWGKGLAENLEAAHVSEYATEFIKNEFQLEEMVTGDTGSCTDICHERYPLAGPVFINVCVKMCEMAKGTSPTVATYPPAHASDKK